MGLGAVAIGAGVLGAGASVATGMANASAAKNAAKAQTAANNAAIGEQQREFDINQSNLAPWLSAGKSALGAEQTLLGLGGGGLDYASYVQNNPDLLAAYQAQSGGSGWAPGGAPGMSIEQFGKNYYDTYGQGEGKGYGAPTYQTAAQQQQAAIDNLKTSPLYTSLYRNGQNAVLANASATGGLRGGNVQSSLANFGADTLASVYQNQLSNLSGLSSLGQNTGGTLGSLGSATSGNISSLLSSNGSAAAGGILGSAGAMGGGINSGLSSLLNSYGQYSTLNNTWAGMGSGLGSAVPSGYGSVDWGASVPGSGAIGYNVGPF